MGKNEGLANTQKRQVHDVWLADKKDQKLHVEHSQTCFSFWSFRGAVHEREGSSKFFKIATFSLRLDWFLHENVTGFPHAWLKDEFAQRYACEETLISPQRWGKPMNRWGWPRLFIQVYKNYQCSCQKNRLNFYTVVKTKYEQWISE